MYNTKSNFLNIILSLLFLIQIVASHDECTYTWWNELTQQFEVSNFICTTYEPCKYSQCVNNTHECQVIDIECPSFTFNNITYPSSCINDTCIVDNIEIVSQQLECINYTYNFELSQWTVLSKFDGTWCNKTDECARYSCYDSSCIISQLAPGCSLSPDRRDITLLYIGVIGVVLFIFIGIFFVFIF